jgi:hypothetical protein
VFIKPNSEHRTAAWWIGCASASCGLLGAIVGLSIGLYVYPPTAWFALIEIGFPSAVLGGLTALIIVTARRLYRRFR